MIDIIILINALLLGLVASLSPCLFPVLPTFIAYLTNSEANRWRGILSATLVTAGIMTIFLILSFLYNSLIRWIAPNYLQFRATQGIILIVLGILLVVGISVQWNWLNKLNSFADKLIDKVDNPWLTSYLIGFTFTLLAAPCAIIVFATAFTLAADTSILVTVIVMMVFSIGAGIPFLLVGGLLPSAKEFLIEERHNIETTITLIAGIIIIGVGGYLTLDGLQIL